MSTCKNADVVSVLERTDPTHPPSFNYALEVVKRYSRAKIAKGSGRQLLCKHGKLETLESKFAHLGYQDIFYLTRLQLKLPPSSTTLPSPASSCVKQTLIKAKYPLPADNLKVDVASSSSKITPFPDPTLKGRRCSKQPIQREGRRGSRSITNSPTLPSPEVMRRSSSARPDLPSTSTSSNIPSPSPARKTLKNSKSSWTINPSSSRSNSSSRSRSSTSIITNIHSESNVWSPLLSGLGIKTSQIHQTHHLHTATTSCSVTRQNSPVTPLPNDGDDEIKIKFNESPFDILPSPLSLDNTESLYPLSPTLIEMLDLGPLHLDGNDQNQITSSKNMLQNTYESSIREYEGVQHGLLTVSIENVI
ncbi:uncharacterized protein IL334_001261 [Kwoniella shivajii]|uniref:Uncharacterized protein n=1 Tax=Kwoniella shivajii TaxID=564305 RepID=A0ABZ1CRF0_9TREE|nr:hypothetical protein IL334_001261 [Kwoniella shivajii]